MDGQAEDGPTWGAAGERPGAPRAEDQLEEQGVTPRRRRAAGPQAVQSWVDQAVRQAERQGAFDDLPGAGKPLRDIDSRTDPDWWVKSLIEREQLDLSGAMPGVMQLRREKAGFPDSLLDLPDEAAVRSRLEDFNERVLADRRRPHAGSQPPPVVGRVDVDEVVEAWRRLKQESLEAERPPGAQPSPDPGAGVEQLPERPRPRRRLGTRRWWGQVDR